MAVTKTNNYAVNPREIDFVSRFTRNWEALREVMGISRPIKKEAGTKLRALSGSISLESGYVGEGEVIPYSTASVAEIPLADLTIEKFRKGVTIEAINKYGYEIAVQKTDDAMLNELQNVVTGRFYRFLQSGSLASNVDTFQMALAMAKGEVLNSFKAKNLSVAGVVGFCNVLDAYAYLGGANITIQNAFGMQYVKDFMGYQVLFLENDSNIPRGKVIATPVENIVCYYADPSDSAFANAGLQYTVEGETNLIGFHTEGNYATAVSDNFALMGMVLYAEYLDGIAVVTIGEEETPTLAFKTGTILGKAVSDLQDGTSIDAGLMRGRLKRVNEAFGGFDLAKGNHFLALQFGAVADADSIKVGLFPSQGTGMVTLDSDLDAVFQVASSGQMLAVETTVDGIANTKWYSLAGLSLE